MIQSRALMPSPKLSTPTLLTHYEKKLKVTRLSNVVTWKVFGDIKAGFYMNLSEEGLKERKPLWSTTRQLNAPEMAP